MSSTSPRGALPPAQHSLWTLVFLSSLGGLVSGYNSIIATAAVERLKLTDLTAGVALAAHNIGFVVGLPVAGWLAYSSGRRLVILYGSFLVITFALTSTIPLLVLIIGSRALVGVGCAFVGLGVPLLVSEEAPVESRGRVVTVFTVLHSVGLLSSFAADAVIPAESSDLVWRAQFMGGGVLAAVLLLYVSISIGESHLWSDLHDLDPLKRRVRENDAEDPAARQEEEEQDEEDGYDETEMLLARKQRAHPHPHSDALSAVMTWSFLSSTLFRTAVVATIARQLTGLAPILNYSKSLARFAGANESATDVTVGVAHFMGILASHPFLDRWGRRPLMLSGLAIVSVINAVAFVLFLPSMNSALPAEVRVASLWLLIFVLQWGVSSAYVAAITEMFPARIRTGAITIVFMLDNTCGALASVLMPTAVASEQDAPWLFFTTGTIALLSLMYLYQRMHETKDLRIDHDEKIE